MGAGAFGSEAGTCGGVGQVEATCLGYVNFPPLCAPLRVSFCFCPSVLSNISACIKYAMIPVPKSRTKFRQHHATLDNLVQFVGLIPAPLPAGSFEPLPSLYHDPFAMA